jgi:hypothetical protein
MGQERQLTHGPHGHILTNTGVWSPDSQWIVYDTRSDSAGEVFDGTTIKMVNARTAEVRRLYRSSNGAHCGVATFHPRENKVVFILGPGNPTPDWRYAPQHRQGVIIDVDHPGITRNLDARDIVPPFTPGALRGGSHVHVFNPDGILVSFTYEDHVLANLASAPRDHDLNQRNVGVCLPRPVLVPKSHPRNHDGDFFAVLVTRTTARPGPGSDEISRAFEEAWVGTDGYLRRDGTRQRYALAFQGHVVTDREETISEVFIVDLPDNLRVEGEGPLQGTPTRSPYPPKGTTQRRLTRTADQRFPGLQGPRHWPRSSPDGSRIAFLMRDEVGIVQLWTISPNGGDPVQLTRNPWDIASAFTWTPNAQSIAHVMDNSVFLTDAITGEGRRITPRAADPESPRPEACVVSPDGGGIAYVRRVREGASTCNQIFVAPVGRKFAGLVAGA